MSDEFVRLYLSVSFFLWVLACVFRPHVTAWLATVRVDGFPSEHVEEAEGLFLVGSFLRDERVGRVPARSGVPCHSTQHA